PESVERQAAKAATSRLGTRRERKRMVWIGRGRIDSSRVARERAEREARVAVDSLAGGGVEGRGEGQGRARRCDRRRLDAPGRLRRERRALAADRLVVHVRFVHGEQSRGKERRHRGHRARDRLTPRGSEPGRAVVLIPPAWGAGRYPHPPKGSIAPPYRPSPEWLPRGRPG